MDTNKEFDSILDATKEKYGQDALTPEQTDFLEAIDRFTDSADKFQKWTDSVAREDPKLDIHFKTNFFVFEERPKSAEELLRSDGIIASQRCGSNAILALGVDEEIVECHEKIQKFALLNKLKKLFADDE